MYWIIYWLYKVYKQNIIWIDQTHYYLLLFIFCFYLFFWQSKTTSKRSRVNFTKHLFKRFQVVPIHERAKNYIVCADILSFVRADKLYLSVCLHVPVTIYVHLEQSVCIDRNDAPGTREITSRFYNESLFCKRV